MRKLNEKVQNLSLKYKLTFLTLFVAIIPLLLCATMIILMYTRVIVQRSNKHIEENIQIMTERINTVFDDGVLCSNYLTLNINSIENASSKKNQIKKDSQISSQLNQSLLIFDGIKSIVFVSEDGQLYTTDVRLEEKKEEILQSQYISELKNHNGKTKLYNVETSCMMMDGDPYVVTMGKRVINIISGDTIGYLFINLDQEYLEKSSENAISYYLLFDTNGTCVTGSQNEKLVDDLKVRDEIYSESSVKSVKYQGDHYLVARDEIEEYGWTVIGVTNLNEFNVSKEELISILMITSLMIGILLIISIWIAAGFITKPLMKLKEGAEELSQGNLDVTFSFKTKDEIGRLGIIFNDMTKKIKELIANVNYEARKKREYELALIQQQVKPHFLYNTLDIIIMLIEMNRSRDAQRVTKKLADYYKNSLSDSEEIIPIEREFQIVEDYLDLQLMRYGDKFTYHLKLEESAKGAKIPKMTLQPLVENAIYHGLKYKEEWGSISIVAKAAGADLTILVEDKGIGMQEEKLKEVVDGLDQPHAHFGVYSVNHRLKLYFGSGYGIHIESKYQEGTTVTVRIPKEAGDFK